MAVPIGPASPVPTSPSNYLPLLFSRVDLSFFINRAASNTCSHIQEWLAEVGTELRHYRGEYALLFVPRCRHLPQCEDNFGPLSRVPPRTCRASKAWWAAHHRGPRPMDPEAPEDLDLLANLCGLPLLTASRQPFP